jgi:hypothetical protein
MIDWLAAEFAYARAGIPVFPVWGAHDGACLCGDRSCGSPGKHPRTRHGMYDTTTDGPTIRERRQRWPDSNVGLRTGTSGGIIALDVDNEPAVAYLNELRAGGDLGAVIIRTGQGWQAWFRTPADVDLRDCWLGAGVLLVRAGGYVIGPPSEHVNGRRYAIVRGGIDGLDEPPPWLLQELLEALAPPPSRAQLAPLPLAQISARPFDGDRVAAYGRAVLARSCELVRSAEEGARHTILNKASFVVGGFVATGAIDRDDAEEQLRAAAAAAGLGEREQAQTDRTIERGLDAGEARPTAVPESVSGSRRERVLSAPSFEEAFRP